MDTVFYSWQSDLHQKTNRYFIEKALEKAIKLVKKDGLKVDPRIDQDARAATGAADIPAEILRNIEKCRVFVADVSVVNQGAVQLLSGDLASLLRQGTLPRPEEIVAARPTPNPNVLTELGYAAHCLNWKRVICVCNEAYGKVEELPFDIRHRAILKYHLKPYDSSEIRQQQEANLKNQLKQWLAEAIKRTELEITAQQQLLAEAEERRLAEERAKYPILDLQFFDPIQGCPVGKTAIVHCVVVHKPQSQAQPFPRFPILKPQMLERLMHLSGVNEHYSEEMEQFIMLRDLFRPLSFTVENSGRVLASDVHVEATIQKSDAFKVIPWGLRPKKPQFRQSPWASALAAC